MQLCFVIGTSMKLSFTAQKMKFPINDFFSKCDQILDLVAFTEEILNGKLHFCAVHSYSSIDSVRILI